MIVSLHCIVSCFVCYGELGNDRYDRAIIILIHISCNNLKKAQRNNNSLISTIFLDNPYEIGFIDKALIWCSAQKKCKSYYNEINTERMIFWHYYFYFILFSSCSVHPDERGNNLANFLFNRFI